MGGILILITIGSFCLGIELMGGFDIQYGEPPVDLTCSGIISLFLIFAFFAWSDNKEPSFWVYLWLLLAFVGYCYAFKLVLKTTKRVGADSRFTISAICAQALLPLGTALMVLLFIATIMGIVGGGKKKRRK